MYFIFSIKGDNFQLFHINCLYVLKFLNASVFLKMYIFVILHNHSCMPLKAVHEQRIPSKLPPKNNAHASCEGKNAFCNDTSKKNSYKPH